MSNEPAGYRIPIHTSMTTPQLVLGLQRSTAIVLSTTTLALTAGLHSWLAVPVCAAAWIVAARATKREPLKLDMVRRLMKLNRTYRP